MKPYGIPRDKDLEAPDVADIQKFGLKSSTGRVGNDQHAYSRTKNKNASRRIYKKKARNDAKSELRNELS